jgi:hypothetical protein
MEDSRQANVDSQAEKASRDLDVILAELDGTIDLTEEVLEESAIALKGYNYSHQFILP